MNPPIVLDSFTGADLTDIVSGVHAADIPGVGDYVGDAGFFFISLIGGTTGQLLYTSSAPPTTIRHAVYDTNIVGMDSDPVIEASFDVTPGTGANTSFFALAVRHNGDLAGSQDFIEMRVEHTSPSMTRIVAIRMAASVVVDNQVIATGIPFVSRRYGMTLVGAAATFWTEPWGGGARTVRGTFTFTASFADSSHRRFAIRTRGSAEGSAGGLLDNLRIGPEQFPWASPPTVAGLWASPAAVGGSWASG